MIQSTHVISWNWWIIDGLIDSLYWQSLKCDFIQFISFIRIDNKFRYCLSINILASYFLFKSHQLFIIEIPSSHLSSPFGITSNEINWSAELGPFSIFISYIHSAFILFCMILHQMNIVKSNLHRNLSSNVRISLNRKDQSKK